MNVKEDLWELEFYLHNTLRRVIINSYESNDEIKSYGLSKPDEELGHRLKIKVKEGMASPRRTGVYETAREHGGKNYGSLSDSIALKCVELEGLIALVLLGEKEAIPRLRTALEEDKSKNIKRQVVAKMVLEYADSEHISETQLTLETYFDFFTQLVKLQNKLVPVFEASVDIEPLSPEFAQLFEQSFEGVPLSSTLLKIIQPGSTVTEIMRKWPETYPPLKMVAPMLSWVKPRTGVMKYEGENWLFQMHGVNELGLQKLPSALNEDMIEAIKIDGASALQGIPKNMWQIDTEQRPHIDVTYLPGGHTDGVRAWATYLYAQSIECEFRDFNQDDHRKFLQGLVDKNLLEEVFGHYFIVKYPLHQGAA